MRKSKLLGKSIQITQLAMPIEEAIEVSRQKEYFSASHSKVQCLTCWGRSHMKLSFSLEMPRYIAQELILP